MDDRALEQAIFTNSADLLMRMGTAGGGEQRDDGTVRWTIGGSPIDYHNAVVAADLQPEAADAVIAESMRLMRQHGVPGGWHVVPSMRPDDLRLDTARPSASGIRRRHHPPCARRRARRRRIRRPGFLGGRAPGLRAVGIQGDLHDRHVRIRFRVLTPPSHRRGTLHRQVAGIAIPRSFRSTTGQG